MLNPFFVAVRRPQTQTLLSNQYVLDLLFLKHGQFRSADNDTADLQLSTVALHFQFALLRSARQEG
jgi:hypothetical protein